VPKTRDPHAGRLDPAGLVLSIVAIVTLVYTVIEAPRHGWGSAATIGGFVVAAVGLAAFVWWERRVREPMLDVRLFANPRFSAASGAVAIAFFALFGFIFLVTQYFQFVRGYSTLSAGVHTLPFAVAAGVMAPLAAALALRIGTKLVVTGGLVSMSAGLFLAATFTPASTYWGPVVLSMVLIAGGLTLTTAPATAAILGSLSADKAGVGAAVSDTTRELGGTLGVAVVGSVFSSLYGPEIVKALRDLPLPAEAFEAAKESMGAAIGVASQVPEAGRGPVLDAVRLAFMDGMHAGATVAAVAAAVGAVLALALLPARVAAAPTSPAGAAGSGDAGSEADETGDAETDQFPPVANAVP
jgi:DHA2 family multidrug resistance protein-like MFS transporter